MKRKSIKLAGIEYAIFGDDELAQAVGRLESCLCELQFRHGVIKFNSAVAGRLKKRAAAAVYVLMAEAYGPPTEASYPSQESRIFTMACMVHFATTPDVHLTSDFQHNCDDRYVKQAELGFYGYNAKCKKWFYGCLAELDQSQLDFAYDLFADVHQLDRAEVRATIGHACTITPGKGVTLMKEEPMPEGDPEIMEKICDKFIAAAELIATDPRTGEQQVANTPKEARALEAKLAGFKMARRSGV